MVLHQPKRDLNLREYGILIPVAPDRVSRILAALEEDKRIGPFRDRWLRACDPASSPITREDLERVHAKEYIDRIYSPEVEQVLLQVFELVDEEGNYHRYDPSIATKPLSEHFDPELVWHRCAFSACRMALDEGFCFYLGGGAHHAHYDFGHGFCMLNDILIPLRRLQADGRIKRAWVIDVDAHKGDGTAAIAKDDPTITTLSVHMAESWPLDLPKTLPDGRPNPVFVSSDIDVPIAPGEEGEYLPRLHTALDRLGADFPGADLALVVCGSDAYEHDGLPSTAGLRLTLEQMNKRNLAIYDFLTERDMPQVWYTAGGYGERAWEPFAAFLKEVLPRRLGVG